MTQNVPHWKVYDLSKVLDYSLLVQVQKSSYAIERKGAKMRV